MGKGDRETTRSFNHKVTRHEMVLFSTLIPNRLRLLRDLLRRADLTPNRLRRASRPSPISGEGSIIMAMAIEYNPRLMHKHYLHSNYYSVTDSVVTKNYGVYPEQRRRQVRN